MIFSFEKMAVRDAVKSSTGAERGARGLFDYLHGTGSAESRFTAWVDVAASLPRKQTRVLTWPVVSVFGFIAKPRVHIFLKPTVTRLAAQAYGFDLACPLVHPRAPRRDGLRAALVGGTTEACQARQRDDRDNPFRGRARTGSLGGNAYDAAVPAVGGRRAQASRGLRTPTAPPRKRDDLERYLAALRLSNPVEVRVPRVSTEQNERARRNFT